MVTSFASNAARLQTLAAVAKETGRKLCVAGRSLDRIIRVAKATGYLKDFPEPIDWDAAMRLPRDKVLVIATGGQGEERAALARVAEGTHPIQLDAGDTVIFSSKQIPGNEVAIGRDHEPARRQGHRDGDRAAGARPRFGPPRSPRTRADVQVDPARSADPGPRRNAPHDGAGALRAGGRHPAVAGAEGRRHRPPCSRQAGRRSATRRSGG